MLLYDNLKSAVLERFGEAIRMNPAMLAFSAHHGFEPRPVAVARGNEKGRVERTIRFVRTSFFAARDWTGLADLNRQALAWCDGLCAERAWPEDRSRTVQGAFDEEQPLLLPLPQDRFPVHDRREVHSQKTPYVRYDRQGAGARILGAMKPAPRQCATPDTVRVLDGDTAVAVHARSYDKAATVEDPAHVQGLTDHKRKARRHRAQDRLVEAVPAVRELLVELAARGDALGSAVGQLAKLLDRYGANDLADAVSGALAAGTPHPHNVRMLLERARHRRGLPDPVAVPLVQAPHLRDVHVKPHDLRGYHRLARARKPQTDKEDPDA